MQVEKKKLCAQYVQIKSFEASWPGALVAHRIEPLRGSMRALSKTKDRHGQDVHAQKYKFMLHNLMALIQEYLLLSDDDKQQGALKSLDLVGSTAQLRSDNRICIWLEDL